MNPDEAKRMADARNANRADSYFPKILFEIQKAAEDGKYRTYFNFDGHYESQEVLDILKKKLSDLGYTTTQSHVESRAGDNYIGLEITWR